MSASATQGGHKQALDSSNVQPKAVQWTFKGKISQS